MYTRQGQGQPSSGQQAATLDRRLGARERRRGHQHHLSRAAATLDRRQLHSSSASGLDQSPGFTPSKRASTLGRPPRTRYAGIRTSAHPQLGSEGDLYYNYSRSRHTVKRTESFV